MEGLQEVAGAGDEQDSGKEEQDSGTEEQGGEAMGTASVNDPFKKPQRHPDGRHVELKLQHV